MNPNQNSDSKSTDSKNPQDKSKQTNGWPFPDFNNFNNFNPFMNPSTQNKESQNSNVKTPISDSKQKSYNDW